MPTNYKSLKLQPFPYQGSKRKQTPLILELFPKHINTLYEPFVGSGAVTIAAAVSQLADRYVINDSYGPLTSLWKEILSDPEELAINYERLWNEQLVDHVKFYKEKRDQFNKTGSVADFLYLLAKAAKNAIRFNSKGEFNQFLDTRRKGRSPQKMKEALIETSEILAETTQVYNTDYADILRMATPNDLVYMDPPYMGTSKKKNPRYHQGLDLDRFIKELRILNSADIPFLLSFDGKFGEKTYGDALPDDLSLVRLMVDTGRSAQATLNGQAVKSVESLYVSKELIGQINPSIHVRYV